MSSGGRPQKAAARAAVAEARLSAPRNGRQAGVRTIHLHLVRHALANALNRASVPIVDAAALLGHTPETYMRAYLRPTELGARSAARDLGATLAGGS